MPHSHPLSREEIERVLSENWGQIAQRAAKRAARHVVWNRRFETFNTGLAACLLCLMVQTSWNVIWLARLQASAAETSGLMRQILS